MTDEEDVARSSVLIRLAQSREELRELLHPPRNEDGSPASSGDPGAFPRSRTMRMLMSGKGLGTLGAVASGLLIARPALALQLLKLLPVSAFARTLLVRGFTAWRSKQG